MKKRIFSLVLALSCMAVLSACGEEETAETEESSTAVEIATVERGSISSESNVSGQVVSDGQESVSVALSVRCTDVYVEVGDTVSAGQAICKLDISATMANAVQEGRQGADAEVEEAPAEAAAEAAEE